MNTLSVVYCDKKLKQPNQRGDTKTQKTLIMKFLHVCVCVTNFTIYIFNISIHILNIFKVKKLVLK